MPGRFDPLKKTETRVLDSKMAYVEHGRGDRAGDRVLGDVSLISMT